MKIDRLLTIVTMLLNRDKISSKELADRFEVSVRTIHRDMETITLSGIPIVSYRGNEGGYGILQNYKLDRNFFNQDDFSSIVTALESIYATVRDRKTANALEKVKSLLRDHEKKHLEKMRESMQIDFRPWSAGSRLNTMIQEVRKAIETGRLVSFFYTNLNGESLTRVVEPMTILLRGYGWYLYGFCRTREDFRVFKFTRMSQFAVLEENFRRREKPGAFQEPEENNFRGREMTFSLRIKKNALALLEDFFDFEKIDYDPDGLTATGKVRCLDSEYVYAILLSFGNSVEVLEPVTAREKLIRSLKETSKLYF